MTLSLLTSDSRLLYLWLNVLLGAMVLSLPLLNSRPSDGREFAQYSLRRGQHGWEHGRRGAADERVRPQ